jgi:serine protease Do
VSTRLIFPLTAVLALTLAVVASPSRSAQRDAANLAQQPSSPAENAPHGTFRLVQAVSPEPDQAAGWLGVGISDISAAKATELKLPAARGVLVEQVNPSSPAAKAGLKAGDVITDFGGQRVEGALQFRRLVRETPPGRTVQITYWRDAKSQTASAELASAPREYRNWGRYPMMPRFGMMPGKQAMPGRMPGNFFAPRAPVLGITAMDVSGQLGTYFSVPDQQGVLVTQVRENSPAAKGGLQAGDVITKVNDKRVRDIGDLRAQLAQNRDAKSVTLTVIRKGTETSLTVEPEQPRPPQPRYDTMGGRA